MSTPASQQPSPQLFFQTMNAHQRTEALKAGIELKCSPRSAKATRPSLISPETVSGFGKRNSRALRLPHDHGDAYQAGRPLRLDARLVVFLDKRSPAYLGGAIEFLASPILAGSANTWPKRCAKAARRCRTTAPSVRIIQFG